MAFHPFAAVMGRAIELPEPLLARFPELAEARWRRGGLPPRVAGWCLGQRSVAAVTLWRTVFLGDSARPSADLLLHELAHVRQFQAAWAFPFQYVWASLRHGYHRNRFEVEARAFAASRLDGSLPRAAHRR